MWLFGALHRTCVDFIMMNLFSRLTDSQNRVIVPEPECSPAWLERETMGVLVLERSLSTFCGTATLSLRGWNARLELRSLF